MINMIRAEQYYKKRRYKEAIKVYEILLKDNPREALAYQGLAQCLLQENKLDSALDASKKALELDQKLTVSLITLANIYIKKDQLEEAQRALQKALNLTSNDENIFITLSTICFRRNQMHESISYLLKAIEMNPLSWLAHYNLGLAYVKQRVSTQALKEFWVAFKIHPSNITGYPLLAEYMVINGIWLLIISGVIYSAAFAIHSIYGIPLAVVTSIYFFIQGYLLLRAKDYRRTVFNLLIAIFFVAFYIFYIYELPSIF